MRWIVGLVASLCLLAATGARPERPRGDGGRREIAPVSCPLATHAHRAHDRGSQLRLPPFALAAAAPVGARERVAVLAWSREAASTFAPRPVPSARGPPAG